VVTLLSVLTDILFIVALNTNKSGHHVISYSWHIVKSCVKHQ